jgi:hypothetical protein
MGKPGTMKVEQFNFLKTQVEQFGAKTLASKLAKVCQKRAAALKHECANSVVGAAYASVGTKINSKVGAVAAKVPIETFSMLSDLTDQYGVELVVAKLAKLSTVATDKTLLKSIFV